MKFDLYEHYSLQPSCKNNLIFTVVGFWQIPLSEESRPLTTFMSPFGHYWFNKFISSAPELFQKRMSTILRGLEGVVCQMDDVLVFGHTTAEHDKRLMVALKRIEEAGVTLKPLQHNLCGNYCVKIASGSGKPVRNQHLPLSNRN